ncbi:protein kinase C and casein kinase substrate in neurons protein 1 isoform X1 [Ceratitis capitata]|uniref:Protein kinase C and casein kinase substrate in neurons protein 2 n=2 Tax=Ceratitis capitata TaxID=7213 RepID=W8C0D5_CERCA|nr:protein kinase C and casein kinase substrate in neurons protein 1 isoform X1 [Ceratitis capitata]XP_004518655.1 protein kinase C and casein kinase substrate in neurons protein 1 isoform X1 [Ceratitis capitata]XP_004518658.1 protein kinase C and casein kinase substrate in neurons protein 1 isoform X1 [Ceratitis capitata]XP_004518659.1 protein kinase C and casein kinase substrate in neurons protein 1 isoform X1 [Ceratitis capitata]XP_012159831.1 protein kinase C and casein kinase substrate in 
MSHHSDDHLLQAGSDSFWEPGNYKRTTKRIEDGYKLCNDLQTLIQERADIEKGYAKNLRAWSKKWGELIEKGPEYGTSEASWKSVLTEAERISDVHMKIKENLCNDVSSQIKSWQKDNYHHTLMQIKQRKDMEDMFKKAQKPWAKLLAKVEKTKSDYHAACKTERSATNQERNATADSSLSPDQVKKMHDRVQKTKDQVAKCREKYEQAIAEITKYNSVYIEDMTSVFEKCQAMERTRLIFFKDVLFNIHGCLDLTKVQCLPQIYEEFYHTINNADQQKDLKWWSNNHGVNMAMNWPAFVEYTEEFRDIAKGSKSKEALPAAPITLINQRPVSEDPHEYNTNSLKKTSSSNKSSGRAAQDSASSPTTATASTVIGKSSNSTSASNNRNSGVTNGNGKPEVNPFEEEEEWDEGDNILVDNGEKGVPVKALYDYEGAEDDELTFKQGDVFEKLEDEDEQGWCKGRMNGRVGLYPANYVEPLHT